MALLGWLWWLLLPVRKRLAITNYRQAFPDRDPGELRQALGLIVRQYVDALLGASVQFEGLEHVRRPCLVVSGHFGFWDLGLLRLGPLAKITIFVRPPANALASWWIRRLRVRHQLELLAPSGSKDDAYQALEKGRAVVFVPDQRHNRGIVTNFFGRPCLTSPAFAAMAWRTRAPLVGARLWWDGVYRCRFEPLDWPIPDDRDQAIQDLTQRTQDWLEARIREHPWQWLWLHDRWKGGTARRNGA